MALLYRLYWPFASNKTCTICTPFIYCFFIEQYVHISSVRTCFSILVDTSGMFIMYILNVHIYVKLACLSFGLFSVSASLDIIIMLCHRHGYPWPSLATSPYRSSPLAGLQGYIPYPHIAAGCMFKLVVLLLPGHMWGSIGVHHLWARPCFSSNVNIGTWWVDLVWFGLVFLFNGISTFMSFLKSKLFL